MWTRWGHRGHERAGSLPRASLVDPEPGVPLLHVAAGPADPAAGPAGPLPVPLLALPGPWVHPGRESESPVFCLGERAGEGHGDGLAPAGAARSPPCPGLGDGAAGLCFVHAASCCGPSWSGLWAAGCRRRLGWSPHCSSPSSRAQGQQPAAGVRRLGPGDLHLVDVRAESEKPA